MGQKIHPHGFRVGITEGWNSRWFAPKVLLHTARPGVVIGPKGAEVDKLRNELENLTGRKVKVEIAEIGSPDLNAQLVAEGIAEQMKKRSAFRRVLKQKGDATRNAGAKGIKIQLS